MENEIINVSGGEMLEAINRSEIDGQIATAHKFPRDIMQCKQNMVALAAMDDDVAYNCFYHLERKDKDGKTTVIEGPSVGFTEIISACWKNLRIAGRIIANDGKTITAQGVCHDLESNVAYSTEVKRSILTSKGYTYSRGYAGGSWQCSGCDCPAQRNLQGRAAGIDCKRSEGSAGKGTGTHQADWRTESVEELRSLLPSVPGNRPYAAGIPGQEISRGSHGRGYSEAGWCVQRYQGRYDHSRGDLQKPKQQESIAQQAQAAAESAQKKAEKAMSRSQGKTGTAAKK